VDKKYTTKTFKQTQKLGEKFARELKKDRPPMSIQKGATVLCLHGNLGGGKTTFLQGFAKGLGVKEKVLSPTFIIMKKFPVPSLRASKASVAIQSEFTSFYHIDAYRINKPEEILELGWKEIISNPKNIVAVEWPEKIKKYIPKNSIKLNFEFISETERHIDII
jgi:tRNA threonylcarbamoyladenosine biosynthesis protein TsaE